MKTRLLAVAALFFALGACTVPLVVGTDVREPIDASADTGRTDGQTPADDAQADANGIFGAPDAPLVDANGIVDAPDAPLVDAGCGVSMAQEGSFVDLRVKTTTSPFLNGGAVVPGVYRLTKYEAYFGGLTGTARLRETLVVTGSPSVGAFVLLSEQIETTGEFTSYAPTASRFTYEGANTASTFMHRETCPGSDVDIMNYEATPTSLVLQRNNREPAKTYTKIRRVECVHGAHVWLDNCNVHVSREASWHPVMHKDGGYERIVHNRAVPSP